MYRYENNLSNKCDQLLIENRKNALLIFLLFSLKLRITVWSLTDKSVSYMKYPKSIEKCNTVDLSRFISRYINQQF